MTARDIYNKILIDHYRSTEHRGVPDSFTHSGTGYNHNCGDEITVYLTVNGEMIEDASFEGKGCMICQASASMLAGEVKGKSVDRALGSIAHLNKLLEVEIRAEPEVKVEVTVEKKNEFEGEAEVEIVSDIEIEAKSETGTERKVEKGTEIEARGPDFIALTGIREFPMRIKCATLAWDTAAKLLQSSGSEITSK